MHPAALTVREVAERAGVSVATVSKVLNDRYGVSPATQAKVRAVIEDHDGTLGPSLRNYRAKTLAILVPDLEPFCTELLRGAADAIRGSGYELLVHSSGGLAGSRAGWERRYLSRPSGGPVDGAVLVTPSLAEVRFGLPLVAVDPHTGPSAVPTVDADNVTGARCAVEHLIALGHRRIGMITGRSGLRSAQQREQGYRDALARAGIRIDPSLLAEGGYATVPAAEAARRLLHRARRPTAVFAANDLSALAVLDVADELGLAVPGELSVVGFDDIPEAAQAIPALTTVEQPIREMGRVAAQVLLNLIREHAVMPQHTLATRLVVRGSTGAPARTR